MADLDICVNGICQTTPIELQEVLFPTPGVTWQIVDQGKAEPVRLFVPEAGEVSMLLVGVLVVAWLGSRR